jgi:Rne/Rng family ribonuclease
LPPPARLEAKESPTTQLLAALADPPPDAIVIDDRAAFVQARHWLQQRHPALLDGLRAYAGAAPLLEAENAAAAVESALASRIALAGGGALTIEGTAAATMIDVDVGSPDRRGQAGAATLAGNLCAADAVARHIRLRGLAGPIVVDFIGMARRGDRGRVLERLTAALARYATEADVLGWTRLGHVELVRPRRHTPLSEVLYEHVPGHGSVKRPLTVALEALRAAQREAAVAAGRRLALYMSPEIVAVLAGEGREARRELEERLGRPLEIVAEPGRPRESFDIRVT